MTAFTIVSTPTTSTALVVPSSISSTSNITTTNNNNNNTINQDEIQLYNELKEFLQCTTNRIDIKLVATDAVYQQIISCNDNCYKIIQFNLLPIIIKNCSYEYIDDNNSTSVSHKKDAIANMMVSVTSLKILVYMSSNTLYANQIIHDLLQVVPGFGFSTSSTSSSGGMNRFIEIALSKPPKNINSNIIKDVDTITIIKLWKQQINYSMSLLANITRIEEGAVEMAGKTLQDNAIHKNTSRNNVPINNNNITDDDTNNSMLSLDDNDEQQQQNVNVPIQTITTIGTLEAKPTLDLLLARFLNESFINMDIDYNNMIQLEQEYYNKHPKQQKEQQQQQQQKRLPSTTASADNVDDDIDEEEVQSDNDDDSDIDDDYDLKYGTKLSSTTINNSSTVRSTNTVVEDTIIDKKDNTTVSTNTIVDDDNNNNDNNNNTQSIATKKNIPILLDSFHEDPYQHYASILMNLTQIEQGRQFVLKIHRRLRTTTKNMTTTANNDNAKVKDDEEEEWTVLQKLIGQLKTSINPIRRRGIAGMIKNCLLDSNYSYWFINIVQITNYILYPLAGSEELDIDDKQGLDIDLWMYCYNKKREVDTITRQLVVECILCLCQHGRTAREQLRLRRVYVILKYADMVEENEIINELIYECVNYLRGDEYGTQEGSSDQFVANAYNKVHHPTTIKATTNANVKSTDLLLLKDKEKYVNDSNGIIESSLIDDNNINNDIEEDFDDVD